MFAPLKQVWPVQVPWESLAIVAAVCACVTGVLLFAMDLPTVPVPGKELPDSHPRTSSQLDRADLVELIGNIVHREISSYSLGMAGAFHSGGEFGDGVLN